MQYAGQPLFAVAARSYRTARRAARSARVDYEPLPAILDIRAALAAESYVLPSQRIVRGQPREMLARAAHRLTGTLHIGGQDHFYLEGQIAIAVPQEDGAMLIHSSTQHPSEVQQIVAHALAKRAADVTVQCRRMGGGFGGKETQPALIAAAAAVLACKTGRPVKLRLDRDADMLITGKRHDFSADYTVGFEDDGRIVALTVMLASRCGYSADLSGPVNDRAIMHLDNAYFLEHVEIVSHRCKTHTVSNTAFRGFGGPQGMMVIEQIIESVARAISGSEPLAVRRRNFYGVDEPQPHPLRPIGRRQCDSAHRRSAGRDSSDYAHRRRRVAAWNAANPLIKRGLALTPVKFGISFTATMFNQAGALVHVYSDGTVLLNHGGTEMGQGLFTKVAQVVAMELGLPLCGNTRLGDRHLQGPQYLGERRLGGLGSERQGGAGGGADHPQPPGRVRLRRPMASTAEAVRFAMAAVAVGARELAFAELVQQRVPRAHLAVVDRLLPNAENRVGQNDACAAVRFFILPTAPR